MDTTLLFLLISETIGYLLWILFTKKEKSFYRNLTSTLMFLVALVILYRIFVLNLDFGLILSVATLLAAASWILGSILTIDELRKESKSYFFILLAITCIRSFAYEPYQIPSRSMVPGLQVGDFVLVNKYAYGLKAPGTNYLITDLQKPKRNDVAVFIPPHTLCNASPLEARPDLGVLSTAQSQLFLNKFLKLQKDKCTTNGIKYVKRVIGIPGDEVEVKGYEIWINGTKLNHEFISTINGESLIKETIDNKTHVIRTLGLTEYIQHKWVVPEGSYLAIGDNRDNSLDSRAWGYFSEDTLVGKAEYIWLHWSSFSDLPTFSRNQRID
jgi:signal peptidase I